MGGYVVMVGYPMVVCVARLVSSTYRTPTYHRPSFFYRCSPAPVHGVWWKEVERLLICSFVYSDRD